MLHEFLCANVEWWERLLVSLPEDPLPNVPHRVLDLVAGVLPSRDGEDLVELLQRERFGFWHKQKHKEPENHTPRGIPAESTLSFE